MSRKRIVVIASLVAVVLLGLVFVLVSGGSQKQTDVEPTPGVTPSLSPSPTLSFEKDPHEGAESAHQAEGKDNPVLTELPENNRYWALTFGGSKGNKYVLDATVYYVKGKENPDKKLEEQRPYIIKFLRDIKQPDNTYILRLTASPVDNSYYGV